MTPDICTSLSCYPPHKYCAKCSHANFWGNGKDNNGRVWRWTFNPRFGPLFLRKDGTDMTRQPVEKSPAWDVFEGWYEGKFG